MNLRFLPSISPDNLGCCLVRDVADTGNEDGRIFSHKCQIACLACAILLIAYLINQRMSSVVQTWEHKAVFADSFLTERKRSCSRVATPASGKRPIGCRVDMRRNSHKHWRKISEDILKFNVTNFLYLWNWLFSFWNYLSERSQN